jgi:hypothetical protein
MVEELNRRTFVSAGLKALPVLGLAASSLSVVKFSGCSANQSSRGFSYSGGKVPQLDPKLDHLATQLITSLKSAGGASTFAGVLNLLNATSSVATVLDWFGYEGGFSKNPSFDKARECETCMRNAKKHLRGRASVHTDVVRPEGKLDDVSLMVSGNLSVQGVINIVQHTGQYLDYRAVPLRNVESGLLVAASNLLREYYPLDERLKPYSVTAIDNRTVSVASHSATRIETPVSTILHIPTLSQFPEYDKGIIFAHLKLDKNNPDNIRWAGLQA